MKFVILVSALATVAFGKAVEESEVDQDVFGNYKFASNDIAQEVHHLDDGTVVGSYSYIDKDGVLQRAEYVADENGFRIAATNLPVAVYESPVQDTPEVAAAKAKHLAAVAALRQRALAAQKKVYVVPEVSNEQQVSVVKVPVTYVLAPVKSQNKDSVVRYIVPSYYL